jgi:hypothetical protein
MKDMLNYHQKLNRFNYIYNCDCDDYDDTDYSIWRTKSGKEIPVIEMTDSHLLNAINLINRNANESNERWFDVLAIEADRRKLPVPIKSQNFQCDATESDLY